MSRIDMLLEQMTQDEKIAMLAGSNLWFSTGIPRLGIPAFRMADGPNGLRGIWSEMSPTSAATPVGVALGATWNPAIVEKIAGVLAEETRDKCGQMLLGPTVNMHRTPIAGRNFECFSEDPYLSGTLASAYVKGLQDKGIGACIKHFVANDQEHERFTISSEVDERTLREIYLEPFRLAVQNAKPWAVMSSYNRVNGTYACQNEHTLLDILKGEWGFDGVVISDWFGTYDEAAATGGLDIEMPGPARWVECNLVKQALADGRLSEERLNDKVRRQLLLLERLGLFDAPEQHAERAVDSPKRRKVIREAAGEAIVLLKNKDLLPLRKAKTIAVIGPHAAQASIFGGGSSSGFRPHYTVSPYKGIKQRVGDKVKVEVAPGCAIHRVLPAIANDCLSTADGQPGLAVRFFNGTQFAGTPAYTTITPYASHGWFYQSVPEVAQDAFSMIEEGFFTPSQSGLHTLSLSGFGWSKLYLDGKLLIEHPHNPDSIEEFKAEVELEGGKAYPLRVEFYWQGDPRWRSVWVGHLPPQPRDMLSEALKLAKKADVVILVVSSNVEWETEGFDRADMKLPGAQNELIERVLKANKNTVVVVNAGSPVEMPWIEQAAAVVQLWYNSQEQGNALADVLFGDVNPSGKLPTTFPVRLEDNPAYTNYPGENGQVRYGEGIFIGYRYYDRKKLAPLFPFGHGLSYTSFRYSNLRLSKKSISADESLTVRVDVENTGEVTGKEVVQLYVSDVQASVMRPEKELKAFAKLELKPGQKKTVSFTLDRQAFWFFDTLVNAWRVEPGAFDILIGASSADLREQGRVVVKAD